MKKISADLNSGKINLVIGAIFLSGFIFVYLNPQKPMSYFNFVLGGVFYLFYNRYANKIATIEMDDKSICITLPKKETEQIKIKNIETVSTNGVLVNKNYLYSIFYKDLLGNVKEVKFISLDEQNIVRLKALIEK